MVKQVDCIRCGQSAVGRGRMCLQCLKARNAECVAAIALVQRAVRRGEIKRAKDHACVDCGKTAHDYEHRDYTKPMDVVPVCRSCNQLRGAALDSRMRAIPAPDLKAA